MTLTSPGLPAARAQTLDQPVNRVTIHQAPGFTGPSKSWDLPADQLFQAIPYAGALFDGAPSVQVGAELGVVLFQSPFFTSADETCDYQLGDPADPTRWWISDKVRVVPDSPVAGPVGAELPEQPVGSLIIYRRRLGPPPGVLLLERRRYVNWGCTRPTKARGYKRLFIPAAVPPSRVACFNLDAALSYGEGTQVRLDFSAASLLLLLLPRDLAVAHDAVAHRYRVGLFDAANCEGGAVTFAEPGSGARRIDLAEVGFNRKARSVMIRYDGGVLDEVLEAAGEAKAGLGAPAVVAEPKPIEAPGEVTAAAAASEASSGVAAVAGGAVETEAAPQEAVVEEAVVAEEIVASGSAAGEESLAETVANEELAASAAVAGALGAEAQTAEPAGDSEAGAWPEAAESAAADVTDETATGITVAPAAGGDPEAQAPSEEAEVGLVAAPETAAPETAAPEPAEPGTQASPEGSRTFKYPLLQGYRLHACLHDNQQCGEPAASAWCKKRGFQKAVDFRIDENIGSLFPTLAIDSLELCANFVCDGFQEITCAP